MKKAIFLVFLATAVLGLGYFTKIKTSQAVTVRLKWKHNAQFSGIYSAISKNFYKNNGLKIQLLERDFSKNSISDQVAKGEVDFGITSIFDLIKAIDEGKKIKAVAAIYQESPAAIVSLKESNILSPADLKGKNLGIVVDTFESKFFYKVLLDKYGVSQDEVNFIVTKKITDDLIAKKVDTASYYRTNDTYELRKRGIDYRFIRPEYHGLEMYDDVIITSDEMINKHPDVVRSFVQATVQGWKWAIINEDEAIKFTSKYDSGVYDEVERERHILRKSTPLISWNGIEEIGMMDGEKWKALIDICYKYGLIKSSFDSKKLFTDQFVN